MATFVAGVTSLATVSAPLGHRRRVLGYARSQARRLLWQRLCSYLPTMAFDDTQHRVRSLTERILSSERQAAASKAAFDSDVLQAETQDVITTLQLLAIALRGTPPADVVANAEALFAAATARLERVGAIA